MSGRELTYTHVHAGGGMGVYRVCLVPYSRAYTDPPSRRPPRRGSNVYASMRVCFPITSPPPSLVFAGFPGVFPVCVRVCVGGGLCVCCLRVCVCAVFARVISVGDSAAVVFVRSVGSPVAVGRSSPLLSRVGFRRNQPAEVVLRVGHFGRPVHFNRRFSHGYCQHYCRHEQSP